MPSIWPKSPVLPADAAMRGLRRTGEAALLFGHVFLALVGEVRAELAAIGVVLCVLFFFDIDAG
jgi:hypothetical protein